MQRTWVSSPVQEDPTHGMEQENPRATTTEPNSRAHRLQLLSLQATVLKPVSSRVQVPQQEKPCQ